jgi:hypothetical protein
MVPSTTADDSTETTIDDITTANLQWEVVDEEPDQVLPDDDDAGHRWCGEVKIRFEHPAIKTFTAIKRYRQNAHDVPSPSDELHETIKYWESDAFPADGDGAFRGGMCSIDIGPDADP